MWNREMKTFRHVFELIGNTPTVRISKLSPNPKVEIYAKLEGFNPMGSMKDRIALRMIKRAEEEGTLTKNKTIVEATSGNTGISVAWVAAIKGYKCVILMPKSASVERRRIMKALGAKLILASTEKEVIEKARHLAKNPKYFLTDQFANEENWRAHYQTTGEEIWEQTEGKITHFVAGCGTSGTLMGVARRLREHNSKVQVIGVQPSKPKHRQEGLLNPEEYCPEILNRDYLDRMITVEDEDAAAYTRSLLRNEGLFVGVSSGSAMCGAVQLAGELIEGFIVVLFADHGYKYLSTECFR
jgi:cysteine synthase